MIPPKPKNATTPQVAAEVAEFEPLWTERQAAAFLNVEPMALRQGRCRGRGAFATLEWVKLGEGKSGPVRYQPSTVRGFAAKGRRSHVVVEEAGSEK
jgi:hypothetical protein